MDDKWEKTTLQEAYERLSSGKDGLSQEEALKLLAKHGKNELRKAHRISPLRILLSQFASPLVLILIAAGAVSLAIGFLPEAESGTIDSVLILIIVLAVGVSGFFQDWKAEKAIEALRKMSTPTATVIRAGKEAVIPATDIVPGDVVVLEAGDIIPADGKIMESFDMMADESILTGESKAVRKAGGAMLRMNTSLISGRGKMIVITTGMQTEVGRLAEKMGEIGESKTPFQLELASFSRKIFWIVAAVAVLIMAAGYFKYGLYNAFLTSVSLAVAAIPEGLPAVVTLALALGAKTMVSNNALVRKLPVVESVGSVNVICTDKTGTLTKNRMSVTKVFFDDAVYDVAQLNEADLKKMDMLIRCGVLCNNSKETQGAAGNKVMIGDQTEVAIVEFAIAKGIMPGEIKQKHRRVNEMPFTSKRKMMSVLCRYGSKNYVFSKGAPEVLLHRCDKILLGGKVRRLDAQKREEILKQNTGFASHALRVLGFAYKETAKTPREPEMEDGMTFIGLEGMLDPPRDEVRDAIKDCKTAGIRVVMITGDNSETAKAIANEIGLDSKDALSGDDLDKMNDTDLMKALESGVNIFARTTPFDKLRILEILQKENRVIMTGDGVNDSLALKKADVGIAMGERGTEVAKEASDIILLDDNFATIRNTVKEGRRIFDNIRKFVNYLLSSNLAEVFVIFVGTLLIPIDEPILLPMHLLWINLLTDGMPALALGMDPALPDIMKRAPRKKGEGILDRRTLYKVIAMGANLGVLLLGVFLLNLGSGIEIARTTLFMGFVLYEFMRIASIRHSENLKFFDNRALTMALGASIFLQLLIVYSPLNTYFSLVPLGLYEWTVLIALAAVGWVTSIALSKLINSVIKEEGT